MKWPRKRLLMMLCVWVLYGKKNLKHLSEPSFLFICLFKEYSEYSEHPPGQAGGAIVKTFRLENLTVTSRCLLRGG